MTMKEVVQTVGHGTAERNVLFWRSNDGMI